MRINEFLHLTLPEEQWLPTISGILRQFAEEEYHIYKRQPCWYLGKGCQARLRTNANGTQATFIDNTGEQKWVADSIADYMHRFMAHPQMKGRRVYGQVRFNFAAHV